MLLKLARRSHLAALRYHHGHLGLVVGASGDVLDLTHHQQPVDYLAKHHMLGVQEVTRRAGDEELTAVGVAPAVGHREQTRPLVAQGEVLVVEAGPVDAGAASAVAPNEISALDHKILDHSVKWCALIPHGHPVPPHLPRAELAEVLARERTHVGVQLHDHAPDLIISHCYIKKYNRILWIFQLLLNLSP